MSPAQGHHDAQGSAAPSDPVLVAAATVPAQAWRNGGGQTRELLAWPAQGDWQLRISRADIDRDGPFSAFPLVERWFAVLQGHGVVLGFGGGDYTVRAGDEALCFDGAAAPSCRLLDGPTQDLNLMLRLGSGAMLRWRAGEPWDGAFVMRGMYTTMAGRWQCDTQAIDVAADTLLWSAQAHAAPCTFTPQPGGATGSAWWLGFSPWS